MGWPFGSDSGGPKAGACTSGPGRPPSLLHRKLHSLYSSNSSSCSHWALGAEQPKFCDHLPRFFLEGMGRIGGIEGISLGLLGLVLPSLFLCFHLDWSRNS